MAVNFAVEILERFPASRPALVAIDRDGGRRVWHFGELYAQTAGLSGALAARGVGRGDVVMMLVGNRHEWVLAMLACFRIGAIALPCNVQLRRADLEHRVAAANPKLTILDEELRRRAPSRGRGDDARGDQGGARRGAPPGAARRAGRPRPR